MDLRTLRYFTVVAQERNITRAAEKLNMSQPPLSSQMRGLEEELGVTLFLRGKRRLELTEEGILLLRRANQILELTEKTRLELQERVNEVSGTLYLGMVEGRAPCPAWRGSPLSCPPENPESRPSGPGFRRSGRRPTFCVRCPTIWTPWPCRSWGWG